MLNNESSSGGGGIRTHGRLTPTTVFKTAPFNHSGTPPNNDQKMKSTCDFSILVGLWYNLLITMGGHAKGFVPS